MENIVSVYAFICFLFIGSFLNVVAIRTLEGTSVLNPKHSHCPSCGTRLGWRDLVPVLSWLLLRGRCRTCGQPVSRLYPLGELSTALVLGSVLLHGGFSVETFVVLVLFVYVLTLTITDLRAKLMPNKITYPGILMLFLLRLVFHDAPFWEYLLGFAVGGGVLALLSLVPNGMGGGDVKLFAMIGMALGWKLVLLAFFFSCFWGSLIGLPLKWSGRIKPRQPIPFGPFILFGTWTAWVYGAELLEAYMKLFI